MLGAVLAPSVLLCLVVVHRLQWLAVALRFCSSALSFRPGGVLEFRRVKWRAPRLVLRWLALVLFLVIGGTSTLYLAMCYTVGWAGRRKGVWLEAHVLRLSLLFSTLSLHMRGLLVV